jgi:hypothetical protein
MQAHVIEVNDPLMFDYMQYPQHTERAQNWFQSNMYAGLEHLTEKGRQFVQGCRSIYDDITNAARLASVRQAIQVADNRHQPNAIYAIHNYEDLVDASVTMRRSIMADLVIREAWQKQRIDGYCENYLDLEPGQNGHDHYDYRLATDGMVIAEENDERATVTNYTEDYRGIDRKLYIEEKVNIAVTQEAARLSLRSGYDPTRLR